MKAICISLGPIEGRVRTGADKTIILSKTLVFNDYHVVYGGTVVGLAGVLARTGLLRPAPITIAKAGVIRPGREGGEGFIAVRDEDERRRRVLDVAETFLALPGGYGTPGQIRALLTLAHNGPHRQPIAFFTIADYRRRLGLFIDQIGQAGFLRTDDRSFLIFGIDVHELAKETGAGALVSLNNMKA